MVIGVAGTAKNTGKTTTLDALIGEAYRRGRLPGVTGIGYDGEDRDTITLLPKPRIAVRPGMIVTTSKACVQASTAALRVLRTTGHRTPLGDVVICRAEEEGRAVVAGPNKTADLASVIRQLQSLGVADLLVDGSLNRIAPMVCADRIVFATGGSRSTDLSTLTTEASAIETIFSYPIAPDDLRAHTRRGLGAQDVWVHMPAGAVHGAPEIARLFDRVHAGLREVVLPGLITAAGLSVVCERLEVIGGEGVWIMFDDPFKLLLAGEPARVGELLGRLQKSGARVSYGRPSRLSAFTFNPYYPAFDGTSYRAASVDPVAGRAALAAALHTPVVDVKAEGVSSIFDACFN